MFPYLAAALIQLVLAAASAVLAWYGMNALRIVARVEGTAGLASGRNLVFWGMVVLGLVFAALFLVRLRTVHRAWQARRGHA